MTLRNKVNLQNVGSRYISTGYISLWVCNIRDQRSGQFCDRSITQWQKCQLPLLASLFIQYTHKYQCGFHLMIENSDGIFLPVQMFFLYLHLQHAFEVI